MRRLRFRLGIAVQLGLAFVWAYSCPVVILTAVEAIPAVEYLSSRGDLALGFSMESVGDLPSRSRCSDLSLSLLRNSLRLSSAPSEREEKRDDVEEHLWS